MPGLADLLQPFSTLGSPLPQLTGGAPSGEGRRPLPFYSFEVWDGEGALKPGALPEGAPSKVILRIPPASLECHHPIRSQVFLGLDDLPVVIEAGLGLARWTLSGSHGVGPTVLYADGAQSAGFFARNQLQALFKGYAKENRRRSGSGEPLLRMVFAIRDGSVTEFVNTQWWIQPESLPTDSRTASRPMDWAWSLSFWALEEIRNPSSNASPQDALKPPSLDQLQRRGTGILDRLKTAAQGAFLTKDTSLLGKLGALKADMTHLLHRAQDLRRAAADTVNSVRDLTAGVVGQANAILGEVNRMPGLNGNPALGRLLMDTRRWGGSLQRHLTALEQGRSPRGGR